MFRYFLTFIIITVLGYFYEKYRLKHAPNVEFDRYEKMKKFLFGQEGSATSKPILWVHTDYNVNARSWPSFYSRDTKYLNQPYIQMCVESIVRHCGESFYICLIDDDTFSKLVPGWKIDMHKLADPVKNHMRILGTTQLLYYYGGLLLPNSTVVLKDLLPLYKENTRSHSAFTFECIDRNSTSTYTTFFPDIRILGCKKQTPLLKSLVEYLEKLVLKDHTAEMDFLGEANRWLFEKCQNKKMGIVSGSYIGTRTLNDKPVYIDNLLGDGYVDFDMEKLNAIYIPREEVLNRTKYEWFARMSPQQILSSDIFISKYLLLSKLSNQVK